MTNKKQLLKQSQHQHATLIAIFFISFLVASCYEPTNAIFQDQSSTLLNEVKNTMSTSNTARSGNIAIRQEFEAAIKANNVAAIELFIARHPNSEWTANAKKQLTLLKKQL